jgi:histone-lysine N-methyltransferase SETD1
MSRAPAAGFADFFPAAPRAAKAKAKERQRVKSKALDSPHILPVNPDQDASTTPTSRDDSGPPSHTGDTVSCSALTETLAPLGDDTESIQGDLLNGVGSASSHASTVSSVFSAAGPNTTTTTFGGNSSNMSNLTPLTNTDSSPPRRDPSPQRSKTTHGISQYREQYIDPPSQAQVIPQTIPSPQPRIYARDPNKSVKGIKCTYDPQLDIKLSSSEKKKSKPKYTEFGLVCTHNLRGASSYFWRTIG